MNKDNVKVCVHAGLDEMGTRMTGTEKTVLVAGAAVGATGVAVHTIGTLVVSGAAHAAGATVAAAEAVSFTGVVAVAAKVAMVGGAIAVVGTMGKSFMRGFMQEWSNR